MIDAASPDELRNRPYREYVSQHAVGGSGGAAALVDRRDIRPLLPPPQAGPVLDRGCGRGELVRLLLADGFDADGIDISPEQVALARAAGLTRVREGDFRAVLGRLLPDGCLDLASELGPLARLAAGARVDGAAVVRYLRFGAMAADQSPHLDVVAAPPNSVASAGRFTVRPIWPGGPAAMRESSRYTGGSRRGRSPLAPRQRCTSGWQGVDRSYGGILPNGHRRFPICRGGRPHAVEGAAGQRPRGGVGSIPAGDPGKRDPAYEYRMAAGLDARNAAAAAREHWRGCVS